MHFRTWLENFTGITPEDIRWWASYAQRLTFPSEEAARQWVFDRREHADRQSYASVFGISGPEYNRAFADAIPVWKSGKSFKIGKRIRKKAFSWDDVDVRPDSLERLQTAGYVNPFDGPSLGPLQLVPVVKLYKTESHADTPSGRAKVAAFARMLKEGDGYFVAVVHNEDGGIIDGHHRYEVAKLLKMRRVPAQLITFSEDV